ncbi:MAG: thymidylate kinase [Clostridia bacterium]|nr:thymidylate kinase [Clostridia bacterium]
MGFIVVIEGTDGSGKKTQTERLYNRLLNEGKKVKTFSFPNYDSPSSGPVKMYLGGAFGDINNTLDSYQASSLYAVDRLCTYNIDIKPHYENDEIIILDRYTTANILHQAGKISDIEERDKLLDWIDELEFKTLKLPRPDIVLFLDVPVEVSKRLANERKDLKNGQAQDIIEKDKNHLTQAYENGKYVAEKYDWKIINCTDGVNLKSIDEIHELVYKCVEEKLSKRGI